MGMLRLKNFGHDSPRTTLRVPKEDLKTRRRSCHEQHSQQLEGVCPPRDPYPSMSIICLRISETIEDLSVPKFNFVKNRETSATGTCSTTINLKIKVKLEFHLKIQIIQGYFLYFRGVLYIYFKSLYIPSQSKTQKPE